MKLRPGFAVLSILAMLVQPSHLLALGAGAAQEPASEEPEQASPGGSDPAQEESELPRGVFEEAIQVKVVNVKVFVRDKKGNPVLGLTKDDFEVYEDKKQMPITNFYEVSEGRRTDVEPETERRLEGARVASHPGLDPRLAQVPEDERLHLVVYIDNFNIKPFNRNRVFRYLREFLRTELDRQDRVMLVSYNRSLKVERTLTADPTLISNALYSLEKHTGGRVQHDSEVRQLMRDIDEARDPAQMEGRIRMHAESVFNDLQFTLDALKEMVVSLAGIPGRKALLYVSEGLPMRAGEAMFYAADQKIQSMAGDGAFAGTESNLLQALHYDASRRFRDLTEHANANDVTFYTIDAAGLRTSSMLSAESGAYNTNFSTLIESVATQNLHSTIMYMADQTGGQSIVNTNNIGGMLEGVATDFNHYYSLGYAPGHAGSGRRYNIEVKLTRKGVGRLRHRESYRDKSVETEMEDRTLASLKYAYQNNDLGIKLERGESIRRGDGHYMVHVGVRIPIGELVLIPRPDDTHEAKLRVWVGAMDQKGGVSPVQENRLGITIPGADLERAREQYYVYEMPLVMRGGDQRIAVGVRDDMGSRTAFLSRVISVGS